jgi:hypothetical protein
MATEPAVRKLRLANNLVNGQPKIRKMKLNRRDVLGEMTLAELSIVDQVWLATRGENVYRSHFWVALNGSWACIFDYLC